MRGPPLLRKKSDSSLGHRPCVTMMIIFSTFKFFIMQNYEYIYGIDVSKDHLDIIPMQNGEKGSYRQITNRSVPIKKWTEHLLSLGKDRVLCILEPTGAYSSHLLHHLSQRGIAVKLVNPLQSDGFSKAQGIISKTDYQAAHTLALMGFSLKDLPLYESPSQAMQQRKQLLSGLEALRKQSRMLKNQLHAYAHQVIYAPQVVASLEATLHTVETQIELLEEQLEELSDEDHEEQLKLIQSVKGIGPKTAQLLLACTGGLEHFDKAKQLAKFIGLVPASHYSGSSVRKTGRITKRGSRALRASLYMATRSAKRYNLACKALYDRLRAAGKPHRQANVAVMHKLLKQAFGVVKSGVSFDNQHYLKFIVH